MMRAAPEAPATPITATFRAVGPGLREPLPFAASEEFGRVPTLTELSPEERRGHLSVAVRSLRNHREVARECVCGDLVWADPEAPTQGLRKHQQRPMHAAWRKANGL